MLMQIKSPNLLADNSGSSLLNYPQYIKVVEVGLDMSRTHEESIHVQWARDGLSFGPIGRMGRANFGATGYLVQNCIVKPWSGRNWNG